MADEVLYELGIDIGSSLAFHDGDIKLAKYDENLIQAISNRLNTRLDELDIFYEDYGSVLPSFFGWRAVDETFTFIKSEVEYVLLADERISYVDCSVEYDSAIIIKVSVYLNNEYSIDAVFELTENGVEYVNNEDVEE